MTPYLERQSEPNQPCTCGHGWRVHSKKDGKCLGGSVEQPMGCDCEQFDREDMPAKRIDARAMG